VDVREVNNMEFTTMTYMWIGTGVLMFLIFCFMIYLFYQKIKLDKAGKIRGMFIYDDRTIERKNFYGIVDTLEYNGITYDYNDNLTIKIKGIKHAYFYVGNKNQIDIHAPKDNAMNFADYQKILKSKVLKDLLEDDEVGLSKAERLLLIAIIITGIALFLVIWYYSQQPQEIIFTEATREAIKQSVIAAIKG
jgi:hypothetical protein